MSKSAILGVSTTSIRPMIQSTSCAIQLTMRDKLLS
jgi:hypothetical protein